MTNLSLRSLGLAVLLGCLLLPGTSGWADKKPEPTRGLEARLRRPVALVAAGDGKYLYTANQRSGSISMIDLGAARPLAEVEVGRHLADLAATPDGRELLAADEGTDELVVLALRDGTPEVVRRVAVPRAPVRVMPLADGSGCLVASLWARQVSRVDLAGKPERVRTLDLPFSPRELLNLPGGKLLVADAFGGKLGLVDLGRWTLDSVRTIPAHNIRGLVLDPGHKEILVAHQTLSGRTPTTLDDIHWGNLVTNNVRLLALKDILTPGADLLRETRVEQLGDVGRGAADPGGLVVADGCTIVALSGVGEVALRPAPGQDWVRLPVGRRPTRLARSPDGKQAFVANTLADSVSVLDVSAGKVIREIRLGPGADLRASDRGELLFYDGGLSHDRWLSCHSCHTDGHTNGLVSDTLGDDSYGAPKRVLTLRGVKDTGPWAWNGGMTDLNKVLAKSIRTTMRGPDPTPARVADLEAFLQTLPPPPAPQPSRAGEKDQLRRGEEVFHAQGCAACHPPPTYTSAKTYNVGLYDEVGNSAFNPPSLRGVGQGGPFFHDNRAASLEEVVGKFRHQLKKDLAPQEKSDLLRFLRSL